MHEFAHGKPVDRNFRNLMRQYYELADEYRIKTYDIIKEIRPLLEPKYQLSLEIIFDLYLMVFERINLKNGNIHNRRTKSDSGRNERQGSTRL